MHLPILDTKKKQKKTFKRKISKEETKVGSKESTALEGLTRKSTDETIPCFFGRISSEEMSQETAAGEPYMQSPIFCRVEMDC